MPLYRCDLNEDERATVLRALTVYRALCAGGLLGDPMALADGGIPTEHVDRIDDLHETIDAAAPVDGTHHYQVLEVRDRASLAYEQIIDAPWLTATKGMPRCGVCGLLVELRETRVSLDGALVPKDMRCDCIPF